MVSEWLVMDLMRWLRMVEGMVRIAVMIGKWVGFDGWFMMVAGIARTAHGGELG